jgi:hypothetical protein
MILALMSWRAFPSRWGSRVPQYRAEKTRLHFLERLTETVVTTHKENAKTVTDGLMMVQGSGPADTLDCSQQQTMLLYEWMLFRQAHNPLVNAHIVQPVPTENAIRRECLWNQRHSRRLLRAHQPGDRRVTMLHWVENPLDAIFAYHT